LNAFFYANHEKTKLIPKPRRERIMPDARWPANKKLISFPKFPVAGRWNNLPAKRRAVSLDTLLVRAFNQFCYFS